MEATVTFSNIKPHHNSKPRQRPAEAVDKVIVPISSEDVSEVENAVNQHLEKDEAGMWKCKLCGKTANYSEIHQKGKKLVCFGKFSLYAAG